MDTGIRIGIVGGGWLGCAIARAAVAAGIAGWDGIALSRRRLPEGRAAARLPEAFWTTDNDEVVARSDVVIMAVRPEDWATLQLDTAGRLLISVMAGIGTDALAVRHGTARVVRSLPNAAAEVGQSYTPWFASAGVTGADRAIVRRILDACGQQDEVQTESDIDYLTGLSGSGPAFPALLAAAMADHAAAQGIPEPVAQRAVRSILVGTGRLFEGSDTSPAEMVEVFRSYRGTTAAAIDAMRAGGFDQAVGGGLAAAHRKSVMMGRQFP